MGKSCCAVGCASRYKKDSGIHFYRFPEDKDKRAKWIAAVSRKNWEPNEHSWLCSKHFVSGSKNDDPLSPDYVPSIFAHIKSPQKRRVDEGMKRYERLCVTKKRRVESESKLEAARVLLELSELGNGVEYCEPHSGTSTMTELSMKDIHGLEADNEHIIKECTARYDLNCKLKEEREEMADVCEALSTECSALRLEVELLKRRQVSEPFTEKFFQGTDEKACEEKVKYFTGLPNFKTLLAVYNFVSADEVPGGRTALTLFQSFVMTLIKFRLNLGDQDLAYRFGVNQSTVTRQIHKWIDILYVRLAPLVKWPDRDELLRTMPMSFRQSYRKCVVIIDCFEIFIERATNLKARAQTWSNYKHHNTIKFLIGIAPQGAVTYISKGWGGRVSDVYLTEHCDLLDKLLPGDLILADRGFNIHESAGLYCAEVKLPPFTRGKKQLSKAEVDTGRKLAHVRIHVERVIGLVRQKYSILKSTLPVNFIMCNDGESVCAIDKVALICCALCNLCESVVSFNNF